MSDHAKLSPSSAHRWMNCPGSVKLCKGFPDTAGADAREGTFAHSIGEGCLRTGKPAASWIGRTSGPKAEFTADEEMTDAVQVYLDAVRTTMLMDNARQQELKIESKVAMAGVLAPKVWGTADALVFARTKDRRLHVFDYKHGVGTAVDVNDNEQLMIYGAAALVTYAGLKVEQVQLHIVQPRCKQNRPWQSTEAIPAMDLMKWADEVVLPAAKLAMTDDAPLVPGTKQCRYCPAKGECPALRAESLAVAQEVFDDDDKPKTPDVNAFTAADVSRLVGMAPRVRKFLESVETRAFELLKSGHDVPGYKLVAKTGNRRWKNDADAIVELTMAGIDPYEKPKLSSPAQAEAKLGKAKQGIVAKLASKPTTGTTMAPVADKRPAVPSAASAFSKLEKDS